MTRNKNFIIFDYDGVIVDSEIIYHSTAIEELKKYNIDINSDYIFSNFSGNSQKPFNEIIFEHFKVPLPENFYPKLIQKIFDKAQQVKPIDGVAKLLDYLSSKNIHYCIASGGRKEWIQKTLEHTNLRKYFPNDMVFTSRDYVANGKPSPEIFLYALKTLGKTITESLVVEDSPNGLSAGVASKIKTLAYIGGSHITEGYIRQIKNIPNVIPIKNILKVIEYI